jgi:hypothetical protein
LHRDLQQNGVKGWNLMMIGKRIGISLIAFALVGAWALPASAAEVSAAPPAKVVKTPVVKKVRRHRPVRLVAAEWHTHAAYRGGAHYLVLGVAY